MRSARGIKSRAQVLVIALIISGLISVLGIAAVRFITSNLLIASMFERNETAFYVAEAGIEDAKTRLKKDPNWFTDTPFVKENEAQFVMFTADGSTAALGSGGYKIVRESASNIIYSVGYVGKNPDKPGARVILRITYDPFTGGFNGFQIL